MNISLTFIRVFFVFMCILFLTAYTTNTFSGGLNITNALIGILAGLAFGALLIGADTVFKSFNLRAFNTAALGLVFGYLTGEAVTLIFKTVLDVNAIAISPETLAILRIGIFLFTAYFGMVMTARASDELYISIPFIKFKPSSQKKKDILVDASLLVDPRITDLAASGLLDHALVFPRFTLKEIHHMAENGDEAAKAKARRCLDVLKKLESINQLELRYVDTDFPEMKDNASKLVRLARNMEAHILTADMSRLQQSSLEGLIVININNLSVAMKPLSQSGEFLNIKIQRYGKEPRQGVGYLDDGTMVVVNGGAEFIGESIKAQVLSVKHTSSGRMIFCNALEENLIAEHAASLSAGEIENSHKNYFAL